MGIWKRTTITCLLATILGFAAFTPGRALAEGKVATLVPPCTFSGALTTPTLGPGLGYFYRLDLQLRAGQSVVATLTTSPEVVNPDLRTGLNGGTYSLGAFPTTTSVLVLPFSADASGIHPMFLTSSTPGTFTVDVATVPPLSVSVGRMRAPKKAKRRRSFTVWATMSDYNALTIPIRFMLDRKIRGRWRPYSSKGAYNVLGGSAPWTYAASLRLPRGTFRIRARFRDAAHPVAKYNAWTTVTVR